MKRNAILTVILLFATMCMAGNVKVLNTEYAGVDIDEEGPYVTINVKMQVSNVKKDECVCVALLNNSMWDGDNMTMGDLIGLTKLMCEGEMELDPVTGTKTITVPVDVPLEAKLLTGNEKQFYLKTFVVDLKKEAIIGQGNMIKFVPNPKESMAKKQQAINAEVMRMATQNLGSNKKGSTGQTTTVEVNCSLCGGTGRVYGYGNPRCYKCDGTGKVTKTKKTGGGQNIFDILDF